MSDSYFDHMDDLPRLRDQCGALALELEHEADPTRRAELTRELAECRQRVFKAEQAERPHDSDQEIEKPAGGELPAQRRNIADALAMPGVEDIEFEPVRMNLEARQDYAGLYMTEQANNAEREGPEGQGVDRERERLHPAIEQALADKQADELRLAGIPAELAAKYEARILMRDESFAGEVVQQIERDDAGSAYIIQAEDERVIVPQIEGADMDVGDDVEVSRDHQGNYEAESGYGYGR